MQTAVSCGHAILRAAIANDNHSHLRRLIPASAQQLHAELNKELHIELRDEASQLEPTDDHAMTTISTTDTPNDPSPEAGLGAGAHTAGRERRLVFTLAGMQFSHTLDFMIMMPLGPVLVHALRIDTQQFALLVSIYTLAAAGSGLLAAAFVDRFERKGLLLTLFALFTVATLLCAVAPDYPSLLFTRGLAGAFGGVLSAMLQTIVGDTIPFERRGKASGAVMSSIAAASVLGVPVSLMLATGFGWRWPFVAIAAISVCFLLLAARSVPRLPPCRRDDSGRGQLFAAIGAILRDHNHLRAMLFMGLGAFSTFTVIPYLTLYLVGNVGLGADLLPVVYTLGGVAAFLSARWIGALADKWGKVPAYRLIALLSVVPILLQTHMPPASLGWVLLCSTLFFTLGPGRAIPAMAITLSAVQPPLRGTFMSLNSAIQQLACGAAAFLGGQMISRTPTGAISGYDTAGWLAVVLTGFTILLAGKIRMRCRPPAA
jgi:predicted MFS family arabinose efflux permease